MKGAKYSVLAIAILICNIAIIICGVFFIPQFPEEIPKRTVYMGVIAALSVILLVVALCRKEFRGSAKNVLLISYIIAGLVIFRWTMTMYFVYG